jgi:hypothetical protein
MADTVEKSKQPIRVKVYGLLPVTRATYLTTQFLALLVLAMLFAVWLYFPWYRYKDGLASFGSGGTMLQHGTPWFCLAMFVWGVIETIFVLRAFARAEATRRAAAAPPAQP